MYKSLVLYTYRYLHKFVDSDHRILCRMSGIPDLAIYRYKQVPFLYRISILTTHTGILHFSAGIHHVVVSVIIVITESLLSQKFKHACGSTLRSCNWYLIIISQF